MLTRIFSIFVLIITPIAGFTSSISIGDIGLEPTTNNSIVPGGITLIGMLSLIQSILLKIVLPIVVVGTALYIAYQLFTAEGDEARLKQAWKSVTYSSIALIIIALAYALVRIFANIAI